MRHDAIHVLPALLALAVLTGCASMVPTPPGAPAPPGTAAPVEYPEQLTRADGWSPPGQESAPAYASAMEVRVGARAFRSLVGKNGGMRVLIFYNGRLSPQVAQWKTSSREVLEMDVDVTGPRGREKGTQTVRVYSQSAEPWQEGARSVDEVVGHRLETLITSTLLQSGARVLDKALLYRKVAHGAGTGSYSDTEIRALSQEVDLLLEVTFVPNPGVPEGYDVGVKAVRTRDAAVLALTSSAGMPRTLQEASRFVPVAGAGYEETSGVRHLSLDALCGNATDDALHQVALRY